jgi:DNA-binding CsgD family transcriptional regulator/tetratricopeptide (TPR) repeat protein
MGFAVPAKLLAIACSNQYAIEKLEQCEETGAFRRRHAEWCLAFAERAEPKLSDYQSLEWIDLIELEHDNLRVGLSWFLEYGEAEPSLRMMTSLYWFWYTHGHPGEGRRWLEKGLSLSGSATTYTRARALNGAGWIAMFEGDFEAAHAFLKESLALFRGLEDEEGIASALTNLGFVAALWQRGLDTVPALLAEATALKPKLRDRRTVAYLLILEGMAAIAHGDLEQGIAIHEQSLALFREIGDMQGLGGCLTNMGLVELGRANYLRAAELLQEDLRVARTIDDKNITQNAFFGLGGLAARTGKLARAARLWSASETIREVFGIELNPLARSVTGYDDALNATRTQLGDALFQEAWKEGKAMTQEVAAEYALAAEEPVPSSNSAPVQQGHLTPREEEVAALVTQGFSNRRIAEELHLSERTVTTHVRRILKRLGVTSRGEIADRISPGNQEAHLFDSNT